ncbi:TetR/AcrR family transcriptional regulator [uncultured Aquitalea sp.]|uniref:TetR/AcrR family transcriptional regulator n=1 Tax=uncultured Aquitalea sp. TaxID=540272 RepID=UPI0025F9AA69|nr:TetR/AcrR family transcriptional regulator [uncultured Aquitalea sp.]
MKHFSELTPAAERIVDAAEGLIQAVGYNGFSYEDVAQIVGIRKPSIHHHFPGKADLGAMVAQRYTHRFLARLTDIESTFSDAGSRLRAYGGLFADTYATDRRLCICGMLGAESDSLPAEINQEVQRFFEQNLHWLQMVLESGAAKQELALTAPASALAALYLSALEGSMLLGRGRQSPQGPAAVADALFSTLNRPQPTPPAAH